MASTARRIVAFNRVSADGYFSDATGSLDWAVPDAELDAAGANSISSADTILFGRRTFQMFERFWPQALRDAETAQNPHGPGRSTQMHALAVWLNASAKLLFSTTLISVRWQPTRLLPAIDTRAIDALKREPGKDIMIFGSASIVSQLTAHGLIDEYQFVINPVLLGSGRSLVHDVMQRTRLELLESKAYRSGNVSLRYARRD